MTMTNSTNAQPRLDADRSKAHAKAIKARLNDLGIEIKLSHAYEALASSHGFRNWATMSALSEGTDDGRITIAREGRPQYGFHDGARSFGKPLSLSFTECRRHIEIIGRRSRTHVMTSIAAEVIALGSGLLYADASGTDEALLSITEVATRSGRGDDVRVIDFNAAYRDKSSVHYTPFATCTGDEMAEMLAGFMDVEGEMGRMWKGRAHAMLSGICAALAWARDAGNIDVTPGDIKSLIDFNQLVDFTDPEEFPDIPDDVRGRISGYLSALPGFNGALGYEQSQTTLDQHGWLEMQLCRVLGSLDYSHERVLGVRPRLFGRRPRQLDMDTVVNEGLIFVVRLPRVEAAPDDNTHPGRLILGDIHRALKRSGERHGKPPFFVAFDHFDAAASRRDDLGDLVSSLTASNACLLAGSDKGVPLAEFKNSTSIYLEESSLHGECKFVTPNRTLTATFPTDLV